MAKFVVRVALAVLLVGGAVAHARQASVPPTRDPGSANTRIQGTAVISGRVAVADNAPTHAPVRRARVTIESPALSEPERAETDTNGRFQFDTLPAGDYRLVVEKAGFVRAATDPRRALDPISLAVGAGAQVNADVLMQRGGAIEGTIVTDTGEPAVNVTVAAVRSNADGPAPADRRATRTDDRGRFRVHTLPAGEYRVEAGTDAANRPPAPGAAPARTYYPGTAQTDQARILVVSAGQELVGIDFSVTRAPAPSVPTPQPTASAAGSGRIAGQVVRADSGQPIPNATLRLVRWSGDRGTPTAGRSGPDGRFVFADLPPGSYQLTVGAERFVGLDFGQRVPTDPSRRIDLTDGQTFDKADVRLPKTSAIEGRLVDEFGDPVPGVIVQIARVQYAAGKRRLLPVGGGTAPPLATDDLGAFRVHSLPPGEYYVLALSGPFGGSGLDGASGFATTYFPGTALPTDARGVSVDTGRDTTGVTFPLVPAPMQTVSGIVTDAADRPVARATVMLVPTIGGDVRAVILARMASDAAGRFAFRNVAAGSYVVQAFGQPENGGNLGRAPFGSTAFDVPATGDLAVRVGGTSARGRIVFVGPGAPPPAASVTIFPTPVEFVTSPVGGGPPDSVTREDWTFEVRNMSGRRAIRLLNSAPNWALARVTLGGRDVTDEPVDFRNGDIDGLEVTLTSTSASVTGTVTENGKPATDYGVLVFADDESKWRFPSRFMAVGVPNQQGGFRITGLPGGAYRAIAIPAGEVAVAQDPEVLRTLVARATAVFLNDGATQSVTLTLVRR